MNDIIYLEPDAEITSVIDKIRKSQNAAVVLVIPRGGTMAQSIINLKLLMRSAKEHNKAIALVTNDKIANNLANQLKISVFPKVSDAEKANIALAVSEVKPEILEAAPDSNIKVNTYRRYSLENLNAKADSTAEEEMAQDQEEESVVFDEPQFETRKIGAEGEIADDEEASEEDSADRAEERAPEVKKENSHIAVDDNSEKRKKVDVRLERKHLKPEGSRKLFFIIASSVVLLLVIAAGVFYIPKAEATVVLTTRDVDEKIDVLVSKAPQKDSSLISVAGKILELEKETTKSFNATGKKNVGEKATGTIAFHNSYNYSITLKAGTKITSANSKVYTLQSDVTVPAATVATLVKDCKQLAVGFDCNIPSIVDNQKVTAFDLGPDYNIAPTTFTITNYSSAKFYADSKTAFAGGTSREISFVTEDDLVKAETNIKAETLEAAKKELTDQAGKESLKVLEGQISSEIVTEESTKKAGEEAETFDLKLKIKFFVLGFAESDIKKSVIEGVSAKIKADEMIVNQENSNISYKVAEGNIDDGEMKLTATFKGKIGRRLDSAAIKKQIKNKNLSGAKTYLDTIEGSQSSSLSISPSFWKRTPLSLRKINVKFDYVK